MIISHKSILGVEHLTSKYTKIVFFQLLKQIFNENIIAELLQNHHNYGRILV